MKLRDLPKPIISPCELGVLSVSVLKLRGQDAPRRHGVDRETFFHTLSFPRIALFAILLVLSYSSVTFAHPLGNFTINHFTRIEVGNDRVKLYTVIDMAEIPTFQELEKIDADGNGKASSEELDAFLNRAADQWAGAMLLTVDGARLPLQVVAKNIHLLPGAGGLETLRVELELAGRLFGSGAAEVHKLQLQDANYSDRIGWREIVVVPLSGVTIFDSSAFSNGVSDELRSYPQDLLAAPLDERNAQLSFSRGQTPPSARPLIARDGRPAQTPARDRLAELIAVPRLTPGLVVLGLLFAVMLGAVHALSPGHGKTVVGAYLVGSRGTARHAAFLGLTVTITHTAGVFALGVATLLASRYVVPEQLFPVLSLLSGAIVAAIGVTLLIRRLSAALGRRFQPHTHTHDGHAHTHSHHDQLHSRGDDHLDDPMKLHSHGGRAHSHLPPGADGSPVTWKSLLALGISGGILPCPSALVVLLAAISLQRVGYGLFLVLAFSIGLASVLTAVGLVFVYAKRLLKSSATLGQLSKVLPVASAFVITCAGLVICHEALAQAGINLFSVLAALVARISADAAAPSFASIGALGLLGLGLIFGLKHATEADHIVAVSVIVSEHKKLGRAAMVGALWGAGHTASLVVVGTIVLSLKVAIPERVAGWLEFAVALMIIGLGVMAFRRALSDRADFHTHRHGHGFFFHSHVHFHEAEDPGASTGSSPWKLDDFRDSVLNLLRRRCTTEPRSARRSFFPTNSENRQTVGVADHSHEVARIGIKPTIVGAVHGLAGSAALTLLVLTQVRSPALGLLYLTIFGIGSILGMLLMSGLVGLPFVLSSRKLGGVHYQLQMLAGALSVLFGLWYAYQTAI